MVSPYLNRTVRSEEEVRAERLKFVCSNKTRAATQSNSTHGNQWWKREVFHATYDGIRTACGIRCEDFIALEIENPEEGGTDGFCARCTWHFYKGVCPPEGTTP